jgi:hypothetical protein
MFGKSIFQSVLDRLDAESPGDDNESEMAGVRQAGIRGLNTSLAFDTERATGRDSVHQAYADMSEPDLPAAKTLPPAEPAPPQEPPEPAPERPPAHLQRLTPTEIAEDLGVCETDTVATLAEKRRSFASANHPDLYPPAMREAATMRMKIANMLVDEAQRRLTRGHAARPSRPPAPSAPQPARGR